ncbi:hypothetical protein CTI12_AA514230 [Artemisia annua]|uniref:Uncharacterized protein n=1 Tax=Artemisia annua TaxID=35608 RepID=A0A2U1L9Y7_ARTAN|nr:hypothetical protein CTI12_AA514230 [Artemisia annua]
MEKNKMIEETAVEWHHMLTGEVPSSLLNKNLVSNYMGNANLSCGKIGMWFAEAVARYEGILSSTGPRARLLRKLLTWTGRIASMSKKIFNLDSKSTASKANLRFVLDSLSWAYYHHLRILCDAIYCLQSANVDVFLMIQARLCEGVGAVCEVAGGGRR